MDILCHTVILSVSTVSYSPMPNYRSLTQRSLNLSHTKLSFSLTRYILILSHSAPWPSPLSKDLTWDGSGHNMFNTFPI